MGAYSTLENKKIKLWKVDALDKSDDLFDEIARGYKMKELMIKKGGTR